MTTTFIQTGNIFSVSPKDEATFYPKLPVGNYMVEFHPQKGFHLKMTEKFESTSKIYGDTIKTAERIINTFVDRTNSTGVMLTGEKGSGKSLLARILTMKLYDLDIPTIIVSSSYHGEAFNKFIQDIDQPAVILFDEFEKVYNRDQQESLLTLLDGVFPTKKLFVLTCNNVFRIDENMINRPGRIFYLKTFHGVSDEFITEYCNDKVTNKEYIENIIQLAGMFNEFNFDMLKALVEEMNRYNEKPKDAIKFLNVKVELKRAAYDVKLYIDNELIEQTNKTINWYPDDSGEIIELDYYLNDNNKKNDEEYTITFGYGEIKSISNKGRQVVFENPEQPSNRLILTKQISTSMNMFNLL